MSWSVRSRLVTGISPTGGMATRKKHNHSKQQLFSLASFQVHPKTLIFPLVCPLGFNLSLQNSSFGIFHLQHQKGSSDSMFVTIYFKNSFAEFEKHLSFEVYHHPIF